MELLKELGRRIQKARKEKGLTQQELADQSHFSLKHVQSCERGVKNPSFEVLRAFCKVLNLSLDSLMNLDLPEDEQAANDMRQLYLSCPPAARKVLLNSTRALADELKEMVKTAGVDPDEHLEDKSWWRNNNPPPAIFLPLCGGHIIGPFPADAPASSVRAGCSPTRGGGQHPRSGRSRPPSCPGKTGRRYAGPGRRSAASARRTLPPAAASAPGFPLG